LSGEVDAMIAPNVTRAIGEGDPRVARLFPDYKAIETGYYRRTRIFPIMHVTTVPSEIVARHPWVVESLVLAFEEAKQLAYQRLANRATCRSPGSAPTGKRNAPSSAPIPGNTGSPR